MWKVTSGAEMWIECRSSGMNATPVPSFTTALPVSHQPPLYLFEALARHAVGALDGAHLGDRGVDLPLSHYRALIHGSRLCLPSPLPGGGNHGDQSEPHRRVDDHHR